MWKAFYGYKQDSNILIIYNAIDYCLIKFETMFFLLQWRVLLGLQSGRARRDFLVPTDPLELHEGSPEQTPIK